ncbi:MAG: Methionyl-tRNA synthetase, partial [uncultured Acidimicrobiales bacterium]
DTPLLHHRLHPLRQRRAPPRVRARAGGGRRAGPLPPPVGRRGAPARRYRRPCAEERARCRSRRRGHERPGRPQRGPLPAPRPGSRRCVRRLPPHQQRPPAPAGCRAAVAEDGREGGLLPPPVRGRLLRRVRAVLRPGRPGGWPLPRARDSHRVGGRGQLVLPALPLLGRARGPARHRATAHRTGGVRRRGAGLRAGRPRRHQRVAVTHPGAGVGHPGPRRRRPGGLRVVGRARQLRDRPRLRGRRRRRRLPALVGRVGRAHPRHRQGHPALSRDLLAGAAALGGRTAPDCDLRAPVPHRRRAQDLEVGGERCRPRGRGGAPRGRRASLVAAGRRPSGGRRRLHRRPPRRPLRRRPGQRARQPGQSGHRHAAPVPRRAAAHRCGSLAGGRCPLGGRGGLRPVRPAGRHPRHPPAGRGGQPPHRVRGAVGPRPSGTGRRRHGRSGARCRAALVVGDAAPAASSGPAAAARCRGPAGRGAGAGARGRASALAPAPAPARPAL